MIYLHTVFYSTNSGVMVEREFPFVDPAEVGAREAIRRMHVLSLRLMDEFKRVPLMGAFPELLQGVMDEVSASDERPHGSYEARVIRRIGGRELVEIHPHRIFGGGVVAYAGEKTGVASLFWLAPKGCKHALTHHEWISYLFGTQISCEDVKEACRIFAR